MPVQVEEATFGNFTDGSPVKIFTLSNSNKVVVEVITYGATVKSIQVPDKSNKVESVVLGFDTLEEYVKLNSAYYGVIAGRFANRVDKGKFTLDGKAYQLPTNSKGHHLHGGNKGFDKVNWQGKLNGDKVELTYVSPDGEEGYPGELTAHVTYSLTEEDELVIEYSATTTAPTIVNLTNHSYFNLGGISHTPSILDHEIFAPALTHYTPVENQIPTGAIDPVKGTPFDFTHPTTFGAHIKDLNDDGLGYDHNFVIDRSGKSNSDLVFVCSVTDKPTGRTLEVYTTEPGIQIYTGGFLEGGQIAGGKTVGKHAAFCLETQKYPDAINKPNFPSVVLRPSETLQTKTVYKFPTQSSKKHRTD